MSGSISIKGTQDGLTISFGPGELGSLAAELSDHLANHGQFFRGARISLNLGGRAVSPEQLGQIRGLLQAHDMVLRTVVTSDQVTEATAKGLGLHVLVEGSERDEERSSARRALANSMPISDAERALLVRRQVRSGQVVRYAGHVVIVGDVNPGAEIWAAGSVVVWGSLRGVARAGATGDDKALICALDLRPAQLRIGDHLARSDENEPRVRPYAEVARVSDGTIIIEPWHTAGRRA